MLSTAVRLQFLNVMRPYGSAGDIASKMSSSKKQHEDDSKKSHHSANGTAEEGIKTCM